ncbi:3-oxoadipate enol-lactonase [Micromonospora pisi]|uniref:3-oxoadipate enol-lactonase n=1 Tax=Micromonospora pisi TaxID=589240 RepID=A0A495JVV9_9ACTN|nr:3-oxoadipate enol-lactonase [Micromonospora pisi]RKR92462.1 3-oxoadipate enol-lactonase [Micromonospora pisi]
MTTRLHATVDGPDGAPVLVLGSSLGTTGQLWRPQLGALTERFRVIRYDHAGHGGSAPPSAPYTIAGLGADLLALLDDLGLRRVSYAGLSLGGMLGMWLAAYAPERVERLALLCTSALLGPPEGWRERAGTVRRDGTGAIADAVVGRWFTPAFAATRPEVVSTYRAMLTTTPAEGYAACCEAIGAMDLRPDLSRIVAPTLVVAGADDPATPVPHAEVIAGLIPGARLRLVESAAHLANVEQPETVTRLLLDHLAPDGGGDGRP